MERCRAEGCSGYAWAKGYCIKHYMQIYRNGHIKEKEVYVGCKVSGCNKDNFCRGFCVSHYHKHYRGTIDDEGNPVIKK